MRVAIGKGVRTPQRNFYHGVFRDATMLPWHMPDWSWWKPWEWPGHILGWLKGWSEYREAAHRARKAKVDADVAEAGQSLAVFEIRVSEMLRRFHKLRNETEIKFPGKSVFPIIERSPDDDPEVFDEAMRRYRNEVGLNVKTRGR